MVVGVDARVRLLARAGSWKSRLSSIYLGIALEKFKWVPTKLPWTPVSSVRAALALKMYSAIRSCRECIPYLFSFYLRSRLGRLHSLSHLDSAVDRDGLVRLHAQSLGSVSSRIHIIHSVFKRLSPPRPVLRPLRELVVPPRPLRPLRVLVVLSRRLRPVPHQRLRPRRKLFRTQRASIKLNQVFRSATVTGFPASAPTTPPSNLVGKTPALGSDIIFLRRNAT